MAPIRRAVHLPLEVYRATMNDTAPADPAKFAPAEPAAKLMIDDLVWWTRALKHARRRGIDLRRARASAWMTRR